MEFHINIISSEGGEPIVSPCLFTVHNRRSDVILKIGDEKLHVSKDLLAVHFPVFEAMLFGNFDEKDKEEVEIKDVVYQEFVDLLNLIYIKSVEITDRTVLHILKLADRFQMEDVMELAKKHLTQSKGFNTAKKLLIADQCRLDSVRDHCLQSFSSVTDLLKELKS
ncbi:hypothetical protein PENTCL1PPCAC_24253 [Pristionchus entomophagus]|uniref:BTB domain-containing protein n=1 Tax=Pristionchus entomophagus TaxID=358040 RepID=A0AAV5U6Q6_9BILA|nr:hypothetical protein PENTCL1PPCAC_24253 [Pristionchus entomophagus]